MKKYLKVNIYHNYLIFKNYFKMNNHRFMLLNRDFVSFLFLFNSFYCDIK